MRKIAVWILALGLMATPALADGNAGTGNDSAKPATGTATDSAKPVTPAKSADKKAAKASLDEELDEMRAQLRAQADQINRQEEEISAMKAQLATEAAHSNNAASEPQPSSTAAPMSVASSAPSGTATPVTSVATASSSPASSAVSSPVTPTATASNYVRRKRIRRRAQSALLSNRLGHLHSGRFYGLDGRFSYHRDGQRNWNELWRHPLQ